MAAAKGKPLSGARSKKGIGGRMPTKRSINLVVVDENKINPIKAVLGILLILVLAAAFGKFLVYDRLAEVNHAQARVTDLTRERGELADRLAAAEASLAVATRPLDDDAAMVRRFADEALDYLRAAYDEEKRRNDAERTASVGRQRAFHDRIEQLERALRRDPGEKSRSQMQEERAERELAQIRQELDSERERHKADLARAAQHEKALEGRLNAMQQREGAVREQLRRVEKRTADYDSLSSQLRRREEEVLESARQFAEAREQWQVVERMLKRRIDELEHGAGSLFEDAGSGKVARQDGADPQGGDPSRLVLPSWVRNLK